MRHLPDGPATSKVKTALILAVDSNLYFLDIPASFTREMVQHFRTALDCHISEEQSTKAMSVEEREVHTGYLDRIIESREKLNALLEGVK